MTPRVDVMIPVYNEERALPVSVSTLSAFLREHVHVPYRILITDNASIDRTEEVGRRLCDEYPHVDYVRLPRKGRGGALKQVWLESPAEFVTYMDVDLSTNLSAFPKMLALLEDGADVVIGSRLRHDADTTRSFKREVLSRGYNVLVKAFFGTRFTDAQCGFKGMRREAVKRLVPHVEDRKWFFDTELLVLAEKSGHRIGEVPVDWIEDLDTRVQLLRTIWDDLVALVRLRGSLRAVLKRIDEGR
ncbi:MAG: glycosyltransferase family 2 protein [Gemmatimonadetes bacterium]|nr:glycosyltransferase family 2 protein [Gemmatimonadota bacterium]